MNEYPSQSYPEEPFQSELTPQQKSTSEDSLVEIIAKIILTIFFVGILIISFPIVLLAMICVAGESPIALMILGGFIILIIAVIFIMKKMWKK